MAGDLSAHMTCWTGLNAATRDNGCVHYIPGSHRWDLLPLTDLANDMDAIHQVLGEDQKAEFDPVAVEMEAVEASFHHPLIVHGSYENRTDRPRRAMVVNAFQDGVQSASSEPLLKGVPAVPNGNEMGGRFFPLLLESAATE